MRADGRGMASVEQPAAPERVGWLRFVPAALMLAVALVIFAVRPFAAGPPTPPRTPVPDDTQLLGAVMSGLLTGPNALANFETVRGASLVDGRVRIRTRLGLVSTPLAQAIGIRACRVIGASQTGIRRVEVLGRSGRRLASCRP